MRLVKRLAGLFCCALAAAAAAAAPVAAVAQDTASIAPADNLVAQGIPRIPASLATEARRYTEARSASFLDWHSTNREMLIRTRFGNSAQLHYVKMPGGARKQITFLDEPIGEATLEPVAGRYVVFARDVGGNEFDQLYRLDIADGKITQLTTGPRTQNGGVLWSWKGDRFVYASTRRNGADRDIWIMDPVNPASDRMLLEVKGGGWSPLDWSRDDQRLLVREYLSVNQSRIWSVDAASGKRDLLTDDGADTVAYGGAQFTPDGRGVYLTTDRGGEFRRLSYLDLQWKAITPLTSGINWDVEGFDLNRDGSMVAFVTNEAGPSKLYLMDTRTRQYRPVAGLPAGVISSLSWHDNSHDLAFNVASAESPSDIYSIDVRTGAVSRWTESELGGIVASKLVQPRVIRWGSFDERDITGLYYRPPASFQGKRPVIVDIHGGPEGQSRPGFQGRRNYYLNELGVAVILPNVRGSTGYGKSFVKLDNGMKREDSVKDIGALLDWIAAQPELDASKVLITGGSYGGYMTLATATKYNDRICCAVDIVGVSNFNTFLKNTESYRRDLRRAEYGDERDPAMAAFFERIAPVNSADKITKPLFVVQGQNDPRVPHTESAQIVARVRRNGGPVWYLLAKDEGHGFAKKANQDFQFFATVLFAQRHLLTAPVP